MMQITLGRRVGWLKYDAAAGVDPEFDELGLITVSMLQRWDETFWDSPPIPWTDTHYQMRPWLRPERRKPEPPPRPPRVYPGTQFFINDPATLAEIGREGPYFCTHLSSMSDGVGINGDTVLTGSLVFYLNDDGQPCVAAAAICKVMQ